MFNDEQNEAIVLIVNLEVCPAPMAEAGGCISGMIFFFSFIDYGIT